jgi:uncharacterized membrane-anchored protein
MKNKILLISLLFPIVSLFFLTIYKQNIVNTGHEFELNISGFDPIDLLSGHYITYRVDYGINPCEKNGDGDTCICLKSDVNSIMESDSCDEISSFCDSFLKGVCKNNFFEAGIEKYYIPESKSTEIDKIVRIGKSKIKIAVDKKGTAVIKDLILIPE